MNIRFILTSPAAAPAQTTVHRVKVITGGGGHRRATAEIGGRMQIVSGPAWSARGGSGAAALERVRKVLRGLRDALPC